MPEPEPDPWADLYADLGVDAQSQPQGEPQNSFFGEAASDEFEPVSPTSSEGEPEGEESPDGELDEDGQPKKRRRRRRRGRGRKGEPSSEVSDDADDVTLPPSGEPIVLEAPAAYDTDGGDFDAPEPPRRPAARGVNFSADEPGRDYDYEDATPAANQSMIDDWNVPSWQQIVAGLYRPER